MLLERVEGDAVAGVACHEPVRLSRRFQPFDRAHAAGLLDEFGIRDHPFMVMHPGANWAPKRALPWRTLRGLSPPAQLQVVSPYGCG